MAPIPTQALLSDQKRRFASASLPQTMELASVLKAILLPHLRQSSKRWPFHDRVLAWLVPEMLADICRFHDSGGPSLAELKSPKAVALLDIDLLNVLARNVERIRPGVIRLLQDLSEPLEDHDA